MSTAIAIDIVRKKSKTIVGKGTIIIAIIAITIKTMVNCFALPNTFNIGIALLIRFFRVASANFEPYVHLERMS